MLINYRRSFWAIVLSILLIGCQKSGLSTTPSNPHMMSDILPTSALLVTSQPPPTFILRSVPQADAVITLEIYEYKEPNTIDIGLPGEGGYDSNVCVKIDIGEVIQPGDDLTNAEVILDRLTLRVDNQQFTQVSRWSQEEILVEYQLGNESKPAISLGPISVCWHVELSSGLHQANLQFRQTSGDIKEYTWYFSLIKNK